MQLFGYQAMEKAAVFQRDGPMLPPRRLLHFSMTITARAIEVIRAVPQAVAYVTGDITRTQYVDYDRLAVVLELLMEHGLCGVIRHSRCGFDYVTGQVSGELGLELYTADTSEPGAVPLWDPLVLYDAALVIALPAEAGKVVLVDSSLVTAARNAGCPVLGVGRTKSVWE